jgi:hypothetical protein
MDDDALDPDEATDEQVAVIGRELERVFGNRARFGPMLLPLVSHDEMIALLTELPDNATDAQLRAGLERIRLARPPLPEIE